MATTPNGTVPGETGQDDGGLADMPARLAELEQQVAGLLEREAHYQKLVRDLTERLARVFKIADGELAELVSD